MNKVRGIRGAITVKGNTKEDIFAASKELIAAIVKANDVEPDDIAGILFTATPDLNADFPAYAVRELNWPMVPLLCAQEMSVPGAMSGVIRILLYVNTTKSQKQIKHQYLGKTKTLRPDLP